MPTPLEWTALLGLVVAAGGCASETTPPAPGSAVPPSGGTQTGGHTKETGHPCEGKGTCTMYRELPDGGAVRTDQGGDAGVLQMCGPCNG